MMIMMMDSHFTASSQRAVNKMRTKRAAMVTAPTMGSS